MFVFALATLWLAAHTLVARWVYRDAVRRGYDGWHAVALVSVPWPVGLSVWLMLRSGLYLAPEGWGSAWG